MSVVAPSLLLPEWLYRKKITITGQANAGTNYQVKLLVGESSGSAGVNFHVEGRSLSFPSAKNISGDLRFSNSLKNTLLDFWVESVSGTAPNRIATIWVEVSDNLSSNQDIYCYYNGLTTNVSNGDNTFCFFDDFDGATIDTTKWTITYGAPTVSGSELSAPSANPVDVISTSGKKSVITDANRGIATRFNVRRTGGTDTSFRLYNTASNALMFGNTSYNSFGVFTYGTGLFSQGQVGRGNNSTGDYIYENSVVGTTSYFAQSSGISGSVTLSNSVNSKEFYMELGGGDVNYPLNPVNFVLVRRFVATEPSYNTAAAEEYLLPGLILYKVWNMTAQPPTNEMDFTNNATYFNGQWYCNPTDKSGLLKTNFSLGTFSKIEMKAKITNCADTWLNLEAIQFLDSSNATVMDLRSESGANGSNNGGFFKATNGAGWVSQAISNSWGTYYLEMIATPTSTSFKVYNSSNVLLYTLAGGYATGKSFASIAKVAMNIYSSSAGGAYMDDVTIIIS